MRRGGLYGEGLCKEWRDYVRNGGDYVRNGGDYVRNGGDYVRNGEAV